MKKWTKILALGACLALGAAGVVACGGDDVGTGGGNGGGAGSKSAYYLVGQSLGGALSVTPEDLVGTDAWPYEYWYAGFTTIAEVPDQISFKTTSTKDVYTLTIDLYKTDIMQIVEVGKGWTGQMGSEVLSPAASDTSDLGSSAGGGDNGNILVQTAGNYTLTLNMTGASPVVTYTRNSDPIVPLVLEYDYYITGEKVSGGLDMYVDYTKFAANSAKDTYTLEIGMQANDVFSFTSTVEQDTNQHPAFGSSIVELADDDTKALVEVEMDGEEPTGNFKLLGGTGTYEFTLVETGKGQEDDKRTLTVSKKADAVPAYDFYVVTNDKSEGALPTDKVYKPMTLNSESGLYEYDQEFTYDKENEDADFISIIVVPAGTAVADATVAKAKFVIGTAYADPSYLSDQIDTSSADWIVTNTDNFTVSIDPVSMLVTIKGEHDTPTYTVAYYGGINGDASWVVRSTADVRLTDSHKAVITVELKEGDEFGFKTYKKGDPDNQIGWGAADNVSGGYAGFNEKGNFKATADGTYTFVITIDDNGNITEINVYAEEDTVYQVSMNGTMNGWDGTGAQTDVVKPVVEKDEEEGTVEITGGIVEITTDLTAGASFGFKVYDATDAKKTQIAWAGIKSNGWNGVIEENFTVTYEGEGLSGLDVDTGDSGNVVVKTSGTYKFTIELDLETGNITKITVTLVDNESEGGETGGETGGEEGGEEGGETGGEVTNPDDGNDDNSGETGGDDDGNDEEIEDDAE